ncbi:MAG: chaperone protein DnaK [Litorilinea sp.]|nr:MAG: chaperone protein DnaK [Litorilinea sp.]
MPNPSEFTSSNKIIGIDLGTTNSVLAVIQDGKPTLLPIQGQRLLPSVVGIDPEGKLLVGTPARNQWMLAPERTVRSIKRKMGQKETVAMAGQEYTPQEISAFILREIKEAACQALGEPVTRAVITVPAYFNEIQRQATLEAGEIAGLEVVRIINEPTAAALAYGYGVDADTHLHILVYDLGGGTFDVSIIELNYGVVDVLATAGDNLLGGDDFDLRLATRLAEEFQEEHDLDLRESHQAWARLLRAAEEAKIELSSASYAMVTLEYIAQDRRGRPLHLRREVSRLEFEELIDDLLERTEHCMDQALADAGLQPEDIDRVLLVGGSTRIPAVWEQVARRMGRDPHGEIDPDAAVALGAAVQAGIIAGDEIDAILVDVTPLSLGIETATFSLRGQIQPDHFVPLIRRNTTIPVEKSQVFTTLFPGQEQIEVKVYQGESPQASQNVLLGSFLVDNLKPNRPDGLTEVTINFHMDLNGILEVTVTDRANNRQVKERLKADRQRMTPEQIAASQARLAAYQSAARQVISQDGQGLPLDDETAALVARARALLEREDLDPDLAGDLADLVDRIERAAAAGDEEAIQALADELIDLLFEVEE